MYLIKRLRSLQLPPNGANKPPPDYYYYTPPHTIYPYITTTTLYITPIKHPTTTLSPPPPHIIHFKHYAVGFSSQLAMLKWKHKDDSLIREFTHSSTSHGVHDGYGCGGGGGAVVVEHVAFNNNPGEVGGRRRVAEIASRAGDRARPNSVELTTTTNTPVNTTNTTTTAGHRGGDGSLNAEVVEANVVGGDLTTAVRGRSHADSLTNETATLPKV